MIISKDAYVLSFRRPTSRSPIIGLKEFDAIKKLLMFNGFMDISYSKDPSYVTIVIDFCNKSFFVADCVKSYGKDQLMNLNLPKEYKKYISGPKSLNQVLTYIHSRTLKGKLEALLNEN